jgi:hypothetical protein
MTTDLIEMVCPDCGKQFQRKLKSRQYRCRSCQSSYEKKMRPAYKNNPISPSYIPKRKDGFVANIKDSDYAMTLDEVADKLSEQEGRRRLHKEYIRQIEFRALRKIQQSPITEYLLEGWLA